MRPFSAAFLGCDLGERAKTDPDRRDAGDPIARGPNCQELRQSAVIRDLVQGVKGKEALTETSYIGPILLTIWLGHALVQASRRRA